MKTKTKIILIGFAIVALPVGRLGMELVRTGHFLHLIVKPTFHEKEKNTVILGNGLVSYSSMTDVIEKLKLKNDDYKIEIESESQALPNRPSFKISVLNLQMNFDGHMAKARFYFFNDRLYAYRRYASDSNKPYGSDIAEIGTLTKDPNLLFRKDSSEGQQYAEWVDVRLEKEIDLWIDIYS